MQDLLISSISFGRGRDPDGKKTTKMGTYKGGRRAAAPPLGGFLSDKASIFLIISRPAAYS